MGRHLLPVSGALALFLLLWASSRFSPGGFLLALGFSFPLYLGLLRWQGRLWQRGPSQAALERLAMKEAWRKGGFLRPEDLKAFLSSSEAESLLEGLVGRGLCRKEGEGYRF